MHAIQCQAHIMQAPKYWFALLILVLLNPGKTLGQLVTFEMQGHMTESYANDFQVGDTFVADYTFDPVVTSVSDPFADAQYLSVVSYTFKFARGYVFEATGDPANPSVGYVGDIEVTNNLTDVAQGYPTATDRYTVTLSAVNSVGLSLPSGSSLDFLQFDFFDTTPTGNPDMLSSDANPTVPPSLALASTAIGRVVYDGTGIPPQPFLTVDSVAVVPEPSALALLALGAIVLVARRRFV